MRVSEVLSSVPQRISEDRDTSSTGYSSDDELEHETCPHSDDQEVPAKEDRHPPEAVDKEESPEPHDEGYDGMEWEKVQTRRGKMRKGIYT